MKTVHDGRPCWIGYAAAAQDLGIGWRHVARLVATGKLSAVWPYGRGRGKICLIPQDQPEVERRLKNSA